MGFFDFLEDRDVVEKKKNKLLEEMRHLLTDKSITIENLNCKINAFNKENKISNSLKEKCIDILHIEIKTACMSDNINPGNIFIFSRFISFTLENKFIKEKVIKSEIKEVVEHVLKYGMITNALKISLNEWMISLYSLFPYEFIKEIEKKIASATVSNLSSEQIKSNYIEEQARAREKAEKKIAFEKKLDIYVQKFKKYIDINDYLSAPIALQANEASLFSCNVSLLKQRTVTTSMSYAGLSYSKKVCGNVKFNTGSYDINRQKSTYLEEIDRGDFWITSKRLGFVGNNKTFQITNRTYLNCSETDFGIIISATGNKIYLIKTDIPCRFIKEKIEKMLSGDWTLNNIVAYNREIISQGSEDEEINLFFKELVQRVDAVASKYIAPDYYKKLYGDFALGEVIFKLRKIVNEEYNRKVSIPCNKGVVEKVVFSIYQLRTRTEVDEKLKEVATKLKVMKNNAILMKKIENLNKSKR